MFRKKKMHQSIEVTRLSSLIATGVEVVGDVIVTDGVRVDGRVAGNVLSKPDARGLLVLSEKGRIDGGVSVHDAVINGEIMGDVEVEHFLELQANARVTGNIRYRNLQMDCGARVRGRLECVADNAIAQPSAPSNVVSLPIASDTGTSARTRWTFWQKPHRKLHPSAPIERISFPGWKWKSGFFSMGSSWTAETFPYVMA